MLCRAWKDAESSFHIACGQVHLGVLKPRSKKRHYVDYPCHISQVL